MGRRTTPNGTTSSSTSWCDQIDHELDLARRKALIRQAEDIMEQDPPVLPVAWEKMNDAWYNYVKGYLPTSSYFGIYDVVRWDTAWLDK